MRHNNMRRKTMQLTGIVSATKVIATIGNRYRSQWRQLHFCKRPTSNLSSAAAAAAAFSTSEYAMYFATHKPGIVPRRQSRIAPRRPRIVPHQPSTLLRHRTRRVPRWSGIAPYRLCIGPLRLCTVLYQCISVTGLLVSSIKNIETAQRDQFDYQIEHKRPGRMTNMN